MITIDRVFVVLRVGNAGTHRETRKIVAAYVTDELAAQHCHEATKAKMEIINSRNNRDVPSKNVFDPECHVSDVRWVHYTHEEVPFVAHVDQFMERFC